MQTKTLLALFCTVLTVFIGGNDGKPTTTTKPTTTKSTTAKGGVVTITVTAPPPPSTILRPLAGARSNWKTKIDPKSKKLFNDYKKIIQKKIQATHKIAGPFTPKPFKYSSQIVSGILHHYLVKLPAKKLAYVTIIDRSWKKEEYGKEEHVTVRPELYGLTDKNI